MTAGSRSTRLLYGESPAFGASGIPATPSGITERGSVLRVEMWLTWRESYESLMIAETPCREPAAADVVPELYRTPTAEEET